jgi:hypothetical protein
MTFQAVGVTSPDFVGPGLLNRRNNCYVNAFLEVIVHLAPLRAAIIQMDSDDEMVTKLRAILMSMLQGQLIVPNDIGNVVEPGRRGEKDCCEFGLNLLNRIRRCANGQLSELLDEIMCIHMVKLISGYG